MASSSTQAAKSATPDTSCRRKVRRHRLAEESGARISFTHPAPRGQKLDLQLLDVSSAGFSFALAGNLPDIEPGSSIDCVVVQIGSCTIRGDMMVIHVTHERGVCGALFYPATDEDLIKLRAVMAGIASAAA